jgi:hypothetical protein
MTQIHTENNICVNLRDLRESFSGLSVGNGFDGRKNIPFGGIENRAS